MNIFVAEWIISRSCFTKIDIAYFIIKITLHGLVNKAAVVHLKARLIALFEKYMLKYKYPSHDFVFI